MDNEQQVELELKIERVKVARLEAMVTAQDEIIGDERRAHVVEIARLNAEVDELTEVSKYYGAMR